MNRPHFRTYLCLRNHWWQTFRRWERTPAGPESGRLADRADRVKDLADRVHLHNLGWHLAQADTAVIPRTEIAAALAAHTLRRFARDHER